VLIFCLVKVGVKKNGQFCFVCLLGIASVFVFLQVLAVKIRCFVVKFPPFFMCVVCCFIGRG